MRLTLKNKSFDCNLNTEVKLINLTGLIMVRNQEVRIKKAIESLKKICDEIVVVDTGSTDNTIKVVQKYENVKIYSEKWIENYSAMRNKCLKHVDHSNWVFILDADEEIISDINYWNIHYLLSQNKFQDNPTVFTTQVKNFDAETFVRKKSIYNLKYSFFYSGYVHEELRNSKNFRVIDTDIMIQNFGTEISEIIKFDKLKRYSHLLLKNIEKEPNNPRWVSLLSPEYVVNGLISREKYKRLLQNFIFKSEIDNFNEENIIYNKYSKYLLARYALVLISEGNLDKVKCLCEYSFEKFKYDANFLVIYASVEELKIKEKENNLLSLITDKLALYKNNSLKLNEESQGSQGLLDSVIVKVLIQLGNYTEAKEITKNISSNESKRILKAELELFNLD